VSWIGGAPGGSAAHVEMLLGAYLLGGLSKAEASAVHAHLACCSACQAEYDELAGVTELLDLLGSGDD